MKTNQKQQTETPQPLPRPLASEISKLHRVVYSACKFNPNRTKAGAQTALTNNELAHIRTNTILNSLSVSLLIRHRVHKFLNRKKFTV